MKKIAKFLKVSEEQFITDVNKIALSCLYNEEYLKEIYKRIRIPERSTKNSAGYDFFLPFSISLFPGTGIKIPTGIRVEMQPNWVLQIYPRSGLGIKYRLQLNNTVGIIDSDYFYSDNEGHIMVSIFNDGHKKNIIELNEGKAFVQGIFIEYGIAINDNNPEQIRNGGFGSTDIIKPGNFITYN